MPPTKLIGHIFAMGVWYIMLPPFFLLLLWCALLFWVIKMSAVTFKNGKKAKAYIVIRCHAAISHKKKLHYYDEELKINYDY